MKLYNKTVSLVLIFALVILSVTLSVNALDIDPVNPGGGGGGHSEQEADYSGYASEKGKSIEWRYFETAVPEDSKPANSLFFRYVGKLNDDVGTNKVIKDSYSPDTPTLRLPDWQHWGDYPDGKDLSYEYLELSTNINTIGHGAFYNASALKTVNITYNTSAPATQIKNILSYAFEGCNNIKTINFYGTKEQWNKINIAEHNGVLNYSIEEMAQHGITFNDLCAIQGHVPGKDWQYDSTGHWHVCSNCGEKCEFATHTMVDKKCTVCEYVETVKLGDLDFDGYLTEDDANILADSLVGIKALTEEQIKIADVNKDTKIDISDCVAIMMAKEIKPQ